MARTHTQNAFMHTTKNNHEIEINGEDFYFMYFCELTNWIVAQNSNEFFGINFFRRESFKSFFVDRKLNWKNYNREWVNHRILYKAQLNLLST